MKFGNSWQSSLVLPAVFVGGILLNLAITLAFSFWCWAITSAAIAERQFTQAHVTKLMLLMERHGIEVAHDGGSGMQNDPGRSAETEQRRGP